MKKLVLAAALMMLAGAANASLVKVLPNGTVNVNTTDEYQFVVSGPDGYDAYGNPLPGYATYTLNFASDLTSTFSLIDTQDEEGDVRYTLSDNSGVLWTHMLTDLGNDAVTSFTELVAAGTYLFKIENLTGATASSKSTLSAVPLPGSALLFGTALLGAAGFARRKQKSEAVSA